MPKKRIEPARPRDMNQLAKLIGDIATQQTTEPEAKPVNQQAKKRGDARAAKLTPARRRLIAQRAAHARWKKKG